MYLHYKSLCINKSEFIKKISLKSNIRAVKLLITRIHVQDNIVTQGQHNLADLQVQESWGPSSEGEQVGHVHDLCYSYT